MAGTLRMATRRVKLHSMINEQLLATLYEKYINGTCTTEEKKKLMELLADPSLDAAQDRLIDQSFDDLSVRHTMPEDAADQIFEKIMAAQRRARAQRKRRNQLSWAAVAASVLLVVVAVQYLSHRMNAPIAVAKKAAPAGKQDFPPPAANRATIVLSNGQTIFLDSAGDGTLVTEGHVRVIKSANGEIAYRAEPGSSEANLYNTLRNPRGSRVLSLKLSDGSTVWLNAQSSLRFPAAFVGNERKVEITGEAYFEVAHNARVPFVVVGNGTEVRVLGTNFNVNAYAEEKEVRVTLLRGVVDVSHNGANHRLKPGQQARVGDAIQVVDNANLEQTMAWKNGFFLFQGASLRDVMRELSRWYDVDVSYEGGTPERRFVGKVGRDYTLSEVLAVLGASDVHYRVEGKRLIVQP